MRAVVLVGGPLDGFDVMLQDGVDTYKAVELEPLGHELIYVLQRDGQTMLFEPIAERRGIRH